MNDSITYTFACGRFYLAVIEMTHEGDRRERLHTAAHDHLQQINAASHLPAELQDRYTMVFDKIKERESVDLMTDDEIRDAVRELVNLFGALCEYETPGP